nr:ragulator complex protein LAMTOR3 [Leptinotarsa decemlineata]
MSIMVEEARKYLQDIIARISGLYCILVTDRDGVPLLKVATEKTPEHATRPNFISTFGLAIDQGSKLGLGKTSTIICSYSQYQVIQMNKLPLVISFITSDSCNTGHVLALETQLAPIVSDLASVVAES